jgi:hypothetical protein
MADQAAMDTASKEQNTVSRRHVVSIDPRAASSPELALVLPNN